MNRLLPTLPSFAFLIVTGGLSADALGADESSIPAASSAELEKKIADSGYDAQELANVRTVIDYLSVDQTPEVMARYFAPGFRASRTGMEQVLQALGHPNEFPQGWISSHTTKVVTDILAKGDRVWVAWTVTGQNTGPIFSLEGTGGALQIDQSAILRLQDGKIVEGAFNADEFSLVRQMGVAFPPVAAEAADPSSAAP